MKQTENQDVQKRYEKYALAQADYDNGYWIPVMAGPKETMCHLYLKLFHLLLRLRVLRRNLRLPVLSLVENSITRKNF